MIYLFSWLILSILICSVGSIFYIRVIKKIESDIFRILLFFGWIVFFVIIPILLLLWVLDFCNCFVPIWIRFFSIFLWILAILIIGIIANKKGMLKIK